jgi:hypothetical protein
VNRRTTAALDTRIATAAEATLTRTKSVSPLDVLIGIGWLPPSVVDTWRQGRADSLQDVMQVRPDRVAAALAALRQWTTARGLLATEIEYLAANRDRRPLRFTADGDPGLERLFRTQWTSPELSAARRERLAEQRSQPPDLVVVAPLKDWTCTGCGGTGDLLVMEDPGPICLTCADMDHLAFLPAGDAALTRRAKKASGLSAVVVRFSRSRKRYERQGILVEEEALARAEEQCLADEEVRKRRRERDRERRANEDLEFQDQLGQEIVRLLPGCPVDRAAAIARHAAVRGSGRVGRSAAGRALDEQAVTLAVVASVRHVDTRYDELLMTGVPRETARDRVRADIDRVLNSWRR